MPRDSVDRLQQAVGAFAARRRALEDTERVLVASLSKALDQLRRRGRR